MISEHASPLADPGGADAGGQNVHVAHLATALAQRGHEVRVYTRRDDPGQAATVRTQHGVTVEHVPVGPPRPLADEQLLPYMTEFGTWLAKRWRGGGFAPDVVHAHFWMSGLAAQAAIGAYNRPLVLTYHTLGSVKRRMLGGADKSPASRVELERQLGKSADRVIAQSTDEVAELYDYGVGTSRISLVTSGVDTQVFRPTRRRFPQRRPRILSVGRLARRKGFADLVGVLPRIPDAELVIAGGPPVHELIADPVAQELLDLATRLRVSDRLMLMGSVPQSAMPYLYRSADVLACVPTYEPFGTTPLEAMACGTPVVAYAVGGLRDSVRHGLTGMLVPPGDRVRLGQQLQQMINDPKARAKLGRSAVRLVRSEYQWWQIAEQMEFTYLDAVSSSAPNGLASAASAISVSGAQTI